MSKLNIQKEAEIGDLDPEQIEPDYLKVEKGFDLIKKIRNQSIVICAYRFDMDINAEQFAKATDKIEEDVKEFIRRLKEDNRKRLNKVKRIIDAKDGYYTKYKDAVYQHWRDLISLKKELSKLAGDKFK